MANPKLVDYIKRGLESGYSKEMIKSALLKEGWAEAEIDQAIEAAKTERVVKTKLNFFQRFWRVLTSPDSLFRQIKLETDIRSALIYFLILFAIINLGGGAVLFWLTSQIQFPVELAAILAPLLSPISIILSSLSSLVQFFIISILLHVFVRVFGAKGPFYSTFNTTAHAYTPVLVFYYFLFPLVTFLLFPIQPQAILILPWVFLVIPIWFLIIMIRGLAIMQGVSGVRTFIAMILTGIVLQIFSAIISLFAIVPLLM